jgi:uncharacterized protein (DUF433 family)
VFAAFNDEQVVRLAGVTRNQLRYWERTAFFVPGFADGDYRAAFGRVYSFRDVVALRVLGMLRNQYKISVQHLREVKDRFARSGIESWAGITLHVGNKRVIWIEPGSGKPQVVATGQYVVESIKLDAVVADTKDRVQELMRRSPAKIGSIERVGRLNHGAATIAGTRIPVRTVKRFHQAGFSVAQIIKEYPDLTVEDVDAALRYELAA